MRIVAATALLTVYFATPSLGAAQPAGGGTVHISSAVLTAGHGISVRGTVRPILRGLQVKLELRGGRTPKRTWTPLGRPVSVTASGRFTVSARLPSGLSALVVRVVLIRGRLTLATGSARRVPIPVGAVLGVKITQPATSTTLPPATSPSPTTTFPSSSSPQPACPSGDTGDFPNCEPPAPNPDKGSTLAAGGALTEGDYLESDGGQYKLIMQGDGNLVLYQEGKALWSSETGGHPGSYAVMQGEGNLVVYDGATATWNSSTWGFSGAHLALQNEGNLVIYQDGHPVWDWGSGYLGNELNQWKLEPGAYLLSPNHEYELIMQSSDGNLVLYHDGQALWSSQTGGEPGSYAVMQGDGNFVIYKPHSGPWSTGTAGHPGAFLRVQNDGNVVVYDGGTALWDWGSGLLGGGGGPTAAETAAVNWAVARIGSTSFYDLCLTFVQDAYQDGTGLNIQPLTKYGAFNSNTYPQQVWDDGFNSGTTGGSNTTPPYGALVFFNDPSDYEYSHVTIMGSGGEMIASPDAFDESAVHYETLEQAAHSGAYAAYVGWWLPDG